MADEPHRPRIADLEAALNAGDAVEILPDGTVVYRDLDTTAEKPLTYRNDLGGEY